MRLLAGIVFVLAACAEDAGQPATSVTETHFDPLPQQPAMPINWADWGRPCNAGIYGLHTCTALDGVTIGWCQRTNGASDPDGDGVYPGECRPACGSQPPYQTRCPSDAEPINTVSEGCYCKQL
jgi:hypothetical protein